MISAFLAGKLGWLALGAGSLLGGWAGKRFLVPYLMKRFAGTLGLALDPKTKDQVEKKLLKDLAIAAIRYAEYKLPDAGTGPDKKALAAKVLARFMPQAQADVLGVIIQEVFDGMDAELREALKKSP